MTDRKAMLDLAERVEAASGPDRELDRLIAHAIGSVPADALPCKGGWVVDGRPHAAPPYTKSIDAAEALKPAHCGNNWSLVGSDGPVGFPWQGDVCGELSDARTPALALVAACLKARAHA